MSRVPPTEKETALVTALVKLSRAVEVLSRQVESLAHRVGKLEAAANGKPADEGFEWWNA